jgi:hypothetical protein
MVACTTHISLDILSLIHAMRRHQLFRLSFLELQLQLGGGSSSPCSVSAAGRSTSARGPTAARLLRGRSAIPATSRRRAVGSLHWIVCHCRHSRLTRCIEVVCFACVSSSGVNLRCARCIEVCSCVVVCCVGWLGLARDVYIFCLKSGVWG